MHSNTPTSRAKSTTSLGNICNKIFGRMPQAYGACRKLLLSSHTINPLNSL